MVDVLTTSTSAFSHRHPSRHVNPAGWPSTVTVEGSQRPNGPITLSKSSAGVLFRNFGRLGDTVRGPTTERVGWTSQKVQGPTPPCWRVPWKSQNVQGPWGGGPGTEGGCYKVTLV